MGSNYHTPYTTATKTRASELNVPLAELDKAISYAKNIVIHCDGDISYDSSTGVLSWSGTLRILFNTAAGLAVQNTIATGNVTLADNQIAYVTLNETNGTALTVTAATVTTAAASGFLAVGRVVLAYRNTTSDKCYLVNVLRPVRKIQAHIEDATTAHAITDPADSPADADALREDLVTNVIPSVDSALNALGTKINSILAVLEAHKLNASS